MNVITETKRLLLREFFPTDAEKMFELNADSEVLKFTGDEPFQSVKETENFLKSYSDYQNNGFGRWAVILKETNEFIGWCGLKKNEENDIDIGFRFFRREWNKGYASESAKAVLDVGFNQLNISVIIARANTENQSSLRVLEKLKMNPYKTGEVSGLGETKYYKITKKEFNS